MEKEKFKEQVEREADKNYGSRKVPLWEYEVKAFKKGAQFIINQLNEQKTK